DGDLGRRGGEDQDGRRRAGVHRGARGLATNHHAAPSRGGRGTRAPASLLSVEEMSDIEIAGYRFRDPSLLETALTHSSYLPEHARLGRGEEETGGRSRVGLAASLLESVIGAIYIEAGLDATRDAILRTMGDAIAATVTAPRKTAKTVLQEWAQAEHHPLPLYRTLDISGPEHRRGFVVEVEVEGNVAQGSGQSKRAAEEAAAAKLLE